MAAMRIGRVEVAGKTHFCERDAESVWLLQGSISDGFEREGSRIADGDYQLLSPVAPGKILVILGGFPRGQTLDEARRTAPRFAAKLPSTVIAAGESVVVPAEIGPAVTVEPELAVVMASTVRRGSPEEGLSAVLGYTCFNDVTHLPFIREQSDFLRAKSIDTFGPLGPWIETGIHESDVEKGLELRATVNGVVVHTGNTREFTHWVGEVISEASRFYTLEPGDLISLGTPLDPATARVGDVVGVEVERIGSLVNHLVGGATPTPSAAGPGR
jgi:2-keto-4-pentenoate hydratase/2-oxohepta-3-ene-1,7-dioic acid hydratase in catechol pathway